MIKISIYIIEMGWADGSFLRRQCKTGSRSRLKDEKKDKKFKQNQQKEKKRTHAESVIDSIRKRLN